MLSRKFIVAAALLVVMLVTIPAAADPTFIETTVPTQICLPDKSNCIDVPEGVFVDKETFTSVDAEIKRLQDAETRLTAQNASFRKSANEFHWLPVAIGAALGIAAGVYMASKF